MTIKETNIIKQAYQTWQFTSDTIPSIITITTIERNTIKIDL